MASYVQLGRGFRPDYETASLRRHPRRRSGGGGLAATLAVMAVVFAAGLLWGRLNAGPQHAPPTADQPMQYYPH